jgi:hypothetical protein
VAQRRMKNQFEMDARAEAKTPRADRKHRSPVRGVSALAMRVLAWPKLGSGRAPRQACPEGSAR